MNSILLLTALLAGNFAMASEWVAHENDQPRKFSSSKNIQVVNFWAAWCKPCRAEMPAMSRWYQQKGQKQKVEMVGIAVDSKESVDAFLKTTPVSYPIWRYTGHNSRAMMSELGNKVGGLPFTIVRRNGCIHQKAIYGQIDGAKLDAAVNEVSKKCPVPAA